MPANDPYKLNSFGLIAPARSGRPVTPSDTVDLDEVSHALNIAVAGTIMVIMADDTVAIPLEVFGGDVSYQVKRVLATGTTATGITALY